MKQNQKKIVYPDTSGKQYASTKGVITAIGVYCLLLLPPAAFSQGVGMNTTGNPPKDAALLEVGEGAPDTKGLLIPRVELTDVAVYAPLTGTAVASLVVYSTTSPTNGNGAGYYYWSGTKWLSIPAPQNGPGTSGQALTSQGAGNPPQWQSVGGGGGLRDGSALGTAMMTAYMDSIGLFTPHTNNCVAGETFVPLFSGSTIGFCMENNERSAQVWTEAVRTCLSVGKRLPEPFEWQVACDQGGAIINMTGNWEWASNFALPMYDGSNAGVGAAVFGNGGCNYAGWGWLGVSAGSRNSHVFRCVH